MLRPLISRRAILLLVLQPSCLQKPDTEAHCLKPWMLHNTSGFCLQLFLHDILQNFIPNCIYFLATDALFLPSHRLVVSTLTPFVTFLIEAAAAHGLLILFQLSPCTLGSSWRFKSPEPNFSNRFINSFIIFTLYKGLKIGIIGPRSRTAFS